MKKPVLALAVTLLLLIGNASAFEYIDSCTNSTHLFREAIIEVSGTTYVLNQTMNCEYGCDTIRNECYKYYSSGYVSPAPLELILFFEAVGLILFMLAITRIDEKKRDTQTVDVVLPLFSAIIFFMLSLQSNNVIDSLTGSAGQVPMLIWLNFGLGIAGLAVFFFMLFKFVKSVIQEGL